MVRLLAILVGLGFVFVNAISFFSGFATFLSAHPEETAEHKYHQESREIHFSFDGPLGHYDRQQLQRGLLVYRDVCASCHSLNLVAFRNFADLGYSEAEVRAIADQWPRKTPIVGPDGDMIERNPLPADRIPLAYPNENAARNANNNALPPDLSLITKAREHGPQYLYSLLVGYGQQAPADVQTPAGLHYNPYFPNLNIAMPPPLADGQVEYGDGTPATVDQMAQDVTAFLAWAAEPNLESRHQMGVAVLIFLFGATVLAYLAYRNVWADRKPKKRKKVAAEA